jgi:hypothetical protein
MSVTANFVLIMVRLLVLCIYKYPRIYEFIFNNILPEIIFIHNPKPDQQGAEYSRGSPEHRARADGRTLCNYKVPYK